MKQQQDYINDISEIRTMMERSTRFLSLSGWAGIMAGVYALAGALIAHNVLNFSPDIIRYQFNFGVITNLIGLAIIVLLLAIATAFVLSAKKAGKRNEKFWNATSRRLLLNMSVPLVAGGIFTLILISRGFIGLAAPLTLIFYGLSLYIASRYMYDDIKYLGFVQILLGLAGSYYIEYGLLLWALGFGVAHIVYGIYIHFKYDR